MVYCVFIRGFGLCSNVTMFASMIEMCWLMFVCRVETCLKTLKSNITKTYLNCCLINKIFAIHRYAQVQS